MKAERKAKRRPIDHITPRLGPERVERMWTAIEEAQAPSRARWVWVAVAALLLLVWRSWPTPIEGAVIASSAAVTLPDGSSLQTADATELRVVHAEPEEVELALTQGRLRCDVSHRARRSFAVRVGELTVLVRGTVFTVEAQDDDVRVQVERGLVEVRMREVLLASLSAGETWSRHAQQHASDEDDGVIANEETSDEEPAREEPAREEPSREEPSQGDRRTGHAQHAPKRTVARETAESLLERANEARLAGDAATAADLYQQLRTTYPHDPRAGLSAFELARISLHALHDKKRAQAALEFALAHGRGFAREDAEALQVEALDGEACRTARDRFLRAYANSAQRARVAKACD